MFDFLLLNLDLVSVAILVAAMGIFGFATYFTNSKSYTNRAFLALAAAAIFWSVTNYISYQITVPELGLWVIRLHMFSAVWFCLAIFEFAYVFPKEKVTFSKPHLLGLLPLVGALSLLTLSPFVIAGISSFTEEGTISGIAPGAFIAVFGVTVLSLLVLGLYTFLEKMFKVPKEERSPYMLILSGVTISFVLIILLNFIFPSFINNTRFVPLGAVFVFPMISFIAYAIVRHKLFDIRTISIGVITFFLSIVTITGVIFSDTLYTLIFNASEFILVIIFSIWLIRSVTREVKQREQIEKLAKDLKVANDRLKELDRQKSEFVSIASHQLRSPITAIRGYISLILEKEFGEYPSTLKEPMERIAESSRLMVKSIEDYLNISRIEQGRMKYEMSDFDLSELTKTVVDEYTPVAKKKGLDLSFAATGKIQVHADIGKIKQVIANLVDNSIKYTPSGSVTVKATLFENKARVTVADTGVGIPKDDIGNLFNKFIRARGANKINTSGTGLGLYVAKQMVEAHKGKVWAESEGKGKGSRFIIELPVLSK